PAPHGGIFVVGVGDNVLMFLLALLVGTIVSAILLGLLKRKSRYKYNGRLPAVVKIDPAGSLFIYIWNFKKNHFIIRFSLYILKCSNRVGDSYVRNRYGMILGNKKGVI